MAYDPNRFGAVSDDITCLLTQYPDLQAIAIAIVERSKEAAIHALMLDPLTSACCTPAQIRDMTLEMFEAEKDFLPEYK